MFLDLSSMHDDDDHYHYSLLQGKEVSIAIQERKSQEECKDGELVSQL